MKARITSSNRPLGLTVAALFAATAAFFAARSFSDNKPEPVTYRLEQNQRNRMKWSYGSKKTFEPTPTENTETAQDETDLEMADDLDPVYLPPLYHPRDSQEWQGMQVDVRMQALCSASAGCGSALACVDNKCGPCIRDGDCAAGESCVLDHCVVTENVACRRKRDCQSDAYCILTGITGGESRGNSDMRAVCLPTSGGKEQTVEEVDLSPGDPAEPAPYEATDLIENVREHLLDQNPIEKERENG